jgi:flagellar basal body-associated protein FliL
LFTYNAKVALAVMAINTVPTGGLVVLTIRQGRPIDGGAQANDPNAPGPMLRMEPLIIQLKPGPDDAGERYLRVAFDLEMKSYADRAAFQRQLPRINDGIISYFSDHTPDDLRGGHGLAHVKAALEAQVAHVLPGHAPKTVYITDFLLQ